MKSVFVRYLFPLLAIVSIALIACYYFISFITSNNIEIAKDKFKIFNKEKQREQVIRNQINDIKIAEAALSIKWANLKKTINDLNNIDYKGREFGNAVYELIYGKNKQLTQIFIVDNSDINPYVVYGGIEKKGVDFKRYRLIRKKIYNKLDYDNEIIEINDKTFVLLCEPYYTGKLLIIFSLENFREELTTVNHDNQFSFLLKDERIIEHSDLKGMTKNEAQEMINPYLDSLRTKNKNNHLGQHLAVTVPVFDNNKFLLFSKDAIENDKTYKESLAVFDKIFNENKKENYKDLIFWLVGISLAALILGIYFAYTNTRPIIELKNKINRVIDGDFNARMEYKANNELDDVANSFNIMIGLILKNREDLINKNNEVENHKLSLEESNRMFKNFAYLVSHDLKQPLRNIASFSTILNKSNLNEKEKGYLKLIIKSCEAMDNIVNGFLELSALSIKENKKHDLVNLNNVLQSALLNNDILIKEKNSKIEYAKLPTIYGNEKQITSLFQNLIANAVKFTKVTPHIKISTVTKNGYHKIQFKDNGVGIPTNKIDDIFLLFKQAKRRTGNGHGIGLAMCKKIVSLHMGEISVTSVVNEGSVFTIAFPVKA